METYPLEVINATGCPENAINMAFTYDTRYVFSNVHFGEPTQYTVQEQSGVFDTLVNMPLYDTLIGTADQAKAVK